MPTEQGNDPAQQESASLPAMSLGIHDMKRDLQIPEEVDERLREWAFYFRDRKSFESCKSIEHRYKPHSDDYAVEGWGDVETSPVPAKPAYQLLRALQTHEAIQKLQLVQRWAITYAFCYPSLPRFVVLRCMKKYVGRRLGWQAFMEQVDIGRMRLYAVTTFSAESA